MAYRSRLKTLHREIAAKVSGFAASDPMKDWFTLEQKHLFDQSAGLSRQEANARLRALEQLHHLVFQYAEKKEKVLAGECFVQRDESFLTIQSRLPSNVLASSRETNFSIHPSLLHLDPEQSVTFDPVSPTAKAVSCLRGMCDEAADIGGLFFPDEGQAILDSLAIDELQTRLKLGVLFQSRFHAINAAIGLASGREDLQVVEFAAGISPRGYLWSNNVPGVLYVETDLPTLMVRKAKMLRNIILNSGEARAGMLHCCGVNVLDESSIRAALSSADMRHPFVMISEGLLLYFCESELRLFIRNMSRVLKDYPQGAWVADIVTQEDLTALLRFDERVAAAVRKIFSLTKREVVGGNPLIGEQCVGRLADEFGLKGEAVVSLDDVADQLGSYRGQRLADYAGVVGKRKIWVFTSQKAAVLA